MTGQQFERIERRLDRRPRRQQAPGRRQHLGPAVEREQVLQRALRVGGDAAGGIEQAGSVLRGERRMDRLALRLRQPIVADQRPHDAGIAEIERHLGETGAPQAVERQVLDLEVGLQPGVAVDLGAELQRLARGVDAGRPGVQHRPAVAQPRDAGAIQQVRVDARDLRRAVGAQAEGPAAELVDELEGLQVELAPGARQQRLDVLEQRRHHELAAIAGGDVEQTAPEFLDVPCLRGQHIGNMLRQQPSRGHAERRETENGIVPAAIRRLPVRVGRIAAGARRQ